MKVGVGDSVSSLFRTRLAKNFDEKTALFHSSVSEDLRIFLDDIKGTRAHDVMLYEQGVIPLEALKEVLKALESIAEEWRLGELEIGEGYEDVHEYIEAKVIEKVGIEYGGMIHTGRSRNDQVVLDIRLRVREELIELMELLLRLVEALLNRGDENTETMMILCTHGQHAQVGTFAHYIGSYADALIRDFERLVECYSRVNLNPLGAGPIGGTSIRIDRDRTRELLGFDDLVENSIDATSGRDWAIEVASTCSILMSNLSRVAADLITWSSAEFAYVEISDEYASSSSIMPQKKNPSTLELVRGKSSEVYGSLTELLTMVKGVNSGYYQDLQQTKIPLWRCLDTTKASVEVTTGVFSTLKVNEEKMSKKLEGSNVTAVDLAEALVEKAGVSFREAYKLVAALVRKVLEEGKNLSDISPADVEKTSQAVLNKKVQLKAESIENAVDPKASLMRRVSQGSSNPKIVAEMLEKRRNHLKNQYGILEKLVKGVLEAEENLRKIVEKIMSG